MIAIRGLLRPGVIVAALVVAALVLTPPAVQSQQDQVLFFENCERGPATPLEKIKRYPDMPQAVASDAMFPGAFPPPSGQYAARCQDVQNAFHGLGSIVVGPPIALDNPSIFPVAIEVKLYLVPSRQYNYKNMALLALDDFAPVEQYYRYGFGGNSVYFQFFDGRGFTEVLYDPILGEQIAVPGWHTLTMRFDSADTIRFYIDGKSPNFSPLTQKSITRFRLGVLIWDQQGPPAGPILADDFRIYKPGASADAGANIAKVSVEDLQKLRPRGPVQPGKPVEWVTDTNAAVERAQKEGEKKFLVYFWREGLSACASIEGNTLLNPAAAQAIGRFVPVKIDAAENRPLVEKYEVFKVPQLLVLDMAGRIYWRRLGVLSVKELEEALARY